MDGVRAPKLVVSLAAAAGLLACAAAALESCVLPDFEVGKPIVDAGPDAVHDAAVEAGPPHCGKTYPDPPVAETDGGADISNTLVLALHAVDLGEGEASPPGYDLDNKCTCFEDAGPTCVSPNQHCDAPDGIDNAGAALINLVSTAVGSANFGSSYFSTKAHEGRWTLLIQVTGYNGLADDPSVSVALFPSKGLGAMSPKWDGSDAWPVIASSVMNDAVTMPIYTSKGAYVANHVLVATMPSVSLTIAGDTNTITMKLTSGVLTGTLASLGTLWRIADGTIAGRWYEPDIFAALSSYRDNKGKPICTDLGFTYSVAKGQICNGLDILKDLSGAKSLPCDSLSVGIGFHADAAKLGAVTPLPMATPGCLMATDPLYDNCSK